MKFGMDRILTPTALLNLFDQPSRYPLSAGSEVHHFANVLAKYAAHLEEKEFNTMLEIGRLISRYSSVEKTVAVMLSERKDT